VTLAGAISSREDYLATHAAVDIILDSFPCPGITTTCEALWMGVPTVTLAGNTMLSRQGASLLTCAGLEKWIADSEQNYIALAIAHASDIDRLAQLRAGLRQRVLASPLFNAPRFALNLEDALHGMWQHAGSLDSPIKNV
jgi:protein O-GlcNAc transferase